MDSTRSTNSQQSTGGGVESHEEIFIRQVDDRALPALQVLAEQLESAGVIPGPLFIP